MAHVVFLLHSTVEAMCLETQLIGEMIGTWLSLYSRCAFENWKTGNEFAYLNPTLSPSIPIGLATWYFIKSHKTKHTHTWVSPESNLESLI